MPQMDGLTFLKALRRQELPVAAIPALVISTEAGPQDREAARAAGANFYLVKPVSPGRAGRAMSAMLCGVPRMNEFLEQFLIECRELVEQATDDLLALEETPDDRERLDSAFRAFHTLKGAAGIVEFAAMGRALHAAEDVLADGAGRRRPVTAGADRRLPDLPRSGRPMAGRDAGLRRIPQPMPNRLPPWSRPLQPARIG